MMNEFSKELFMLDDLQMFNDNTIDPMIEDTFRRDLH
jgi:hypothetical protein